MLTGFSEAFDGALSRVVFDGMLNVDELLRIGEIRSFMYRHAELLPEALPIQDIPVEGRYFQFR